jgi:hypothetical protein
MGKYNDTTLEDRVSSGVHISLCKSVIKVVSPSPRSPPALSDAFNPIAVPHFAVVPPFTCCFSNLGEKGLEKQGLNSIIQALAAAFLPYTIYVRNSSHVYNSYSYMAFL